MAFELAELRRLVARHGRVARVVIADVAGSSPREVGAAMLVWQGGQSGTIGGGALEFQASQNAFERTGFTRHPLGPELGQCCGGAVTLLTEVFEASDLDQIAENAPLARGPGDMPLAVKRLLACARNQGIAVRPRMVQGWYIEPVVVPKTQLWVWGAGHVGRALVSVLDPLPEFELTWVDTALERFPDKVPEHITQLAAQDLARLASHAPTDAQHLILTYSHDLDLALCHALLRHGFDFAGVIGSDTKWARFGKRLRALGHSDAQIGGICCPIGQKSLGKHPQAIAVGVASQLLDIQNRSDRRAWHNRSLHSTG